LKFATMVHQSIRISGAASPLHSATTHKMRYN
jgi:hypothetical protein